MPGVAQDTLTRDTLKANHPVIRTHDYENFKTGYTVVVRGYFNAISIAFAAWMRMPVLSPSGIGLPDS